DSCKLGEFLSAALCHHIGSALFVVPYYSKEGFKKPKGDVTYERAHSRTNCKPMLDQESRLTNVFCRDGKSKVDYKCFGDVVFDLEIEKVAHKNKKAKKDTVGNDHDHRNYGEDPLEKTLQVYFIPTIKTSSFELKPTLISIMQNVGQFKGLPTKKPFTHMKKFLLMVRINNVLTNDIRLRLFPFSLIDKALEWLTAFLDRAITT
ncbi:hypothetical protein CR513_29614, partial [Mucuna pruriens]